MFFSIAAVPKEVCQLQKENTGKVIHNQLTRPLLLFQEEVSPEQIVSDPKKKNAAFKNYQYYLNHKSNILDEFWEVKCFLFVNFVVEYNQTYMEENNQPKIVNTNLRKTHQSLK